MAKMPRSAGGLAAVRYTLAKAREAGGVVRLTRRFAAHNACKTCAVGMGGQRGGMRNELGYFPEVCKKAMQAMAADMQGAIKPDFYSTYSIPQMQVFSPRELESCGRITTPVLAVAPGPASAAAALPLSTGSNALGQLGDAAIAARRTTPGAVDVPAVKRIPPRRRSRIAPAPDSLLIECMTSLLFRPDSVPARPGGNPMLESRMAAAGPEGSSWTPPRRAMRVRRFRCCV